MIVAERTVPTLDTPPEDGSWVDHVVAVTGWDTGWDRNRAHTVDWALVEGRLGTALPTDYKRLVEVFGFGAFDGYLTLWVPGAPSGSDIVEHVEFLARWVEEHDGSLWKPYRLFPAPGGLLQWADTEQAASFHWLTEGPDPDDWPVLCTEDDYREWDRFDGSTAEFVFRLLTDPRHPHSTTRYFDTHWFMPYDGDR